MARQNQQHYRIFDKYVTIPMQAEFKILLTLMAVRRQMSLASLVRGIIVDWLDKNEPNWRAKLSEFENASNTTNQ